MECCSQVKGEVAESHDVRERANLSHVGRLRSRAALRLSLCLSSSFPKSQPVKQPQIALCFLASLDRSVLALYGG